MARHKPERRECPCPWRVVFEEIERNVEGVEQSLGNIVIAAFGMPASAAVAAAQVHSNLHAGWRVLEDTVGDGDILVDQLAPVVAARLELGLNVRIAEFCEGSLVDLHITAAGRGKRTQLAAERLDRVLPELLDIIIGMSEYGPVAAAKVQRARARNGDLRHQLAVCGDELEIRDVDRMAPAHAAFDLRDGLRDPMAARVAWRLGAADCVDRDVAELAVEKAMVGAPAELAVGRKLQSDTLLKGERVLDGLIFGFCQRRLVDLAVGELGALIEQRLRAQQAADVFGAERRLGLRQHGSLRGLFCGKA